MHCAFIHAICHSRSFLHKRQISIFVCVFECKHYNFLLQRSHTTSLFNLSPVASCTDFCSYKIKTIVRYVILHLFHSTDCSFSGLEKWKNERTKEIRNYVVLLYDTPYPLKRIVFNVIVIFEVTTKRTVRITVSWSKTSCQNNGNDSTNVKCVPRNSIIWYLIVIATIHTGSSAYARLAVLKSKNSQGADY